MPDPEAQVLARAIDGLPLALATAGAYLRQSPISFADYLRNYEQKWNLLQRVARELPEYRERTLYTTWDLSFAQIKRQDPCAASLLTLLAYFDNQEGWYELLAAGRDREKPSWFEELVSDRLIFEGAMRTLVDFCLVEVHVETGSYGLHTCVHDWTLDALNRPIDHSQYALAFDRVVSMVSDIDLDSVSTVTNRRRLAAHAIRLDHDRFQTLLREDSWTLHRYSDLETVALLLQTQNKFENAERMYLRALAGYEKALEPDHPDTLLVVQNLGLLYHDRGQIKQAEEMWTRALAGYEKALEPDHPDTLLVVQNLGLLYHGRGQIKQAEETWTRALTGYEKALEPDHPDTLRVVQSLGELYHGRGQIKQAEEMWTRVLAGYEKALEPDHPDTLRVVQSLGELYHGRGQIKQAEEMWTRALAGYEKALEPDHPDTLRVVQSLGELYHGRGQIKQAEEMWTRVLAGYEK